METKLSGKSLLSKGALSGRLSSHIRDRIQCPFDLHLQPFPLAASKFLVSE